MPSTSWELLQQKCGFSEIEFSLFKDLLRSHLGNPENRVGLGGPWPIQRRRAWEKWLDGFIDDGIGNLYWGQGMARKWSLETERDRIRGFLREAVMFAAEIVKRQSRIEKRNQILSEAQRSRQSFGTISDEGILEGYSDDFGSGTECSLLATTPEQGQQGCALLWDAHNQSQLGYGNSPSPETTQQQATAEVIRRLKYRKSFVALNIDPELNESLRKRRYRYLTRCKKVSHHIPLRGEPAGSIERRVLRSRKLPAVTEIDIGDVSSASDTPSSAIKTDSRHSSVFSATFPDLHQCLDLVLETRLNASDEIKLIYGADPLSLPDLTDKIRKRHHLKPHQSISGLKVNIGDKIFCVSLEDPRDVKYISQVIVKNGSRAQAHILVT